MCIREKRCWKHGEESVNLQFSLFIPHAECKTPNATTRHVGRFQLTKDSFAFCLQVRTLFVSGLPVDIKPRELYLLFRPFKVS